jgi:hypothetical protein
MRCPALPRPLQAAPLTAAEVADLVDVGCSQGGGEGRHWVLDPIDGTRGFVGQRQYAVCLGLLQDAEVGGVHHLLQGGAETGRWVACIICCRGGL